MPKLILPVEPYNVSGYEFGSKVGRWLGFRATHLGDDIVVPAGTVIKAIGDSEVAWSEMRAGSQEKGNWGGIVVLRHQYNKLQNSKLKIQTKLKTQNSNISNFYSVYGHMSNLAVEAGDRVAGGQEIGVVAEGLTPENGWWKIPHLHFAIYTGPWYEEILPGYFRIWERRTKKEWWKEPKEFIDNYNNE